MGSLTDLLAPPTNRLEPMGGRRRGQWRVQIQPPWHGQQAISSQTALRIARYLGATAEFWASLRTRYALRLARAESAAAIEREIQPLGA